MPRRPAAVIAARPPTPMARTIAMLLAALLMTALRWPRSHLFGRGGDGLREAANGSTTEHGLEPVVGTALLDDIANRRAAHMAQQDTLEHDMAYVRQRLNAGVCWSGFGEIIAWENYPDYSADRTMEMWWNSPPHHDIMMGEGYNAAGGAWDTAGDGGHYSVMVFVAALRPIAAAASSVLYPTIATTPIANSCSRQGVTAYRLNRSGECSRRRSPTCRRRSARAPAAGTREREGMAW